MSATSYDTQFYDTIRAGCQRSAEVVVPLVMERVNPHRVADIGCGEGHWGAAFAAAGCEVHGFDGDYIEPVIPVTVADLERPGSFTGDFDLAVCLEVAEHLSPERGPSFIAELCAIAPTVLFSAAIPGQPGNGHVHCRWPSYWADRFKDQGFGVTDSLRWSIWDDERVEPWYRQNLMLASRHLAPRDWPIHDVVHPVIWRWVA